MVAPAMGTSGADAAAQAFRAALDSMPGPLFAVLDGGHFDDLEDELAEAGISSRSLFLNDGSDMRRDGPWLVALNGQHTRERIEELALDRPCTVFWSCPDGEQALWRHLRSINEVLIPDDRIPGNGGESSKPIQYERVLFRHWDPNVLGSLLPLLNTQQFARVLGPASAVLMNATDYDGLTQASRPRDFPTAAPGPLRIEPEQIHRFEDSRLKASRRETMRYLRDAAPEDVASMDDQVLYESVVEAEKHGYEFGLSSLNAHQLFAFLYITAGPDIIDKAEFREVVESTGMMPDDVFESIFDGMIEAAEADGMEPA